MFKKLIKNAFYALLGSLATFGIAMKYAPKPSTNTIDLDNMSTDDFRRVFKEYLYYMETDAPSWSDEEIDLVLVLLYSRFIPADTY